MRHERSASRRVAGAWATMCLVCLSTSAVGEVFEVSTFDDGNDGACDVNGCTLREAVILTTGTPEDDEILLGQGVYQLTLGGIENSALGGDLDINFGKVTIIGLGRDETIIDANQIDRIFDVGQLSAATLELRDLTVRNGWVGGSFYGGGVFVAPNGHLIMHNVKVTSCVAPDGGGGVSAFGSAEIYDSVISGNSCSAGFGNGGGLYTNSSLVWPGTITVERSLISGNSSQNGGGGCFAESYGAMSFTNCTFTGNTATSAVLTSFGDIVLESCTVTANSRGLLNSSGSITVSNSIISGNSLLNIQGVITSAGYNLIATDTGTIAGDQTGNVYNVNPMLGPLADNGGTTMTHALLEGSPAIDAGNPVDFPADDQRGAARPADGDGNLEAAPDMGAYEAASEVFTDCNGNGVNDATDIAEGTSLDCDGNGVPDECDIDDGALDCNENGVLDDCEIADGTLHDEDGSGVADECEAEGDLDGNGTVDGGDLGTVLASWGSCGECPADLNGDGVVDGADIGLLLGNWGS